MRGWLSEVRHRRHKVLEDHLDHTVFIFKELVVPEPEHPVSVCQKPLVPLLIALALGMLAAVQFHDEPSLEAEEVGEKGSNGRLSAKLDAQSLAP